METSPRTPANPRALQSVPTPLREGTRGLLDTSAAAGIPSRPLLGRLPLRRVVPMDLHSVMDYQGALVVAGAGLLAGAGGARACGLALGALGTGVALLTDYRLSWKKLIPIEVHEVVDHVWSLSALTLPFALGWARRSPVAAAVHVLAGASTLVASLFTDYRAQRGVSWGRGRVTDPGPVGA